MEEAVAFTSCSEAGWWKFVGNIANNSFQLHKIDHCSYGHIRPICFDGHGVVSNTSFVETFPLKPYVKVRHAPEPFCKHYSFCALRLAG